VYYPQSLPDTLPQGFFTFTDELGFQNNRLHAISVNHK